MATPPEDATMLLAILRDHGIERICKTYRRPPLPSRLLRELFALPEPPPEVHRFIATYVLSPSDLLESLSETTTDPVALAALAVNPRTPPHLLSRLATHDDARVRAQAAASAQLTARDIRPLLRDPTVAVRVAIAANSQLKAQHQAELARDAEPAVRLALVAHPALHPEVAVSLSHDDSPFVRLELAAGARAEPELLLFWADSDVEELQLALLSRRELPQDVLTSLALASSPRIRAAARERLDGDAVLQLFLARRGTDTEQATLARERGLPLPFQRLLSQSPEAEVRAGLAGNPDVAPDIVDHFLTTSDEACCRALAENPGLDEAALIRLARMRHPAISARLAYRHDLSARVRQTLLGDDPDPTFLRHLAITGGTAEGLGENARARLVRDELPSLRALAARSETLADELREVLLRDPAAKVRLALATNPATPDLALEVLREDRSRAVAKAADERWRANRRARPAEKPTEPASPPFADDDSEERGVIGKLRTIFK